MFLRAEATHVVLAVHGFRGSVLHKHWNSVHSSLTIANVEYSDAKFGVVGEECTDDLDDLFVSFPLSQAGQEVDLHQPFDNWAWRMQEPDLTTIFQAVF